MSNCFIALVKCPGGHPVGVGETPRRIVGKAVCMATRVDIEDLCGTDQLCGGIRSGIEGVIHAMNDLFAQHHDSVPGWGVLSVDASNAFNSLKHSALLWNARILWPHCSRFLSNTYRGGQSSLFMVLLSSCTGERELHRLIHYQSFFML